MSRRDRLYLALDTGSPVVGVAAGSLAAGLASRTVGQARSSELLLGLIDEVLAELGARPGNLAGILGLAGPGSFTGLRVGLATAYGLHQALGVPAVALPTLGVLLAAAEGIDGRVVAAVDAIRGEWFVQEGAHGEPRLLKTAELSDLAPATLIGFGVRVALEKLGDLPTGLLAVEPPPLAVVALESALRQEPEWEPASLTRPLYLRDAAATLPKPRPPLPGLVAPGPNAVTESP